MDSLRYQWNFKLHVEGGWPAGEVDDVDVPSSSFKEDGFLKLRRGFMRPTLVTLFSSRKPEGAPSERLCRRCQRIDLKAVFNLSEVKTTGIPVLVLEKLEQSHQAFECSLCDLFTAVRTSKTSTDVYHLRVFEGPKLLKGPSDILQTDPNNLVLAVIPGRTLKKSQIASGTDLFRSGLITQQKILNKNSTDWLHQYGSRAVESQLVDYPRMRHWISSCKAHNACGSPGALTLPRIRLIDCTKRQIIPMAAGNEYFALSYVWGTRMIDEAMLLKDGNIFKLPSVLPQTVEDAMKVVQELGGRYLWVDRYCIRQDDSADKHEQILKMDCIYEGAIATIVDAAGDSAFSGLCGVSYPRDRQPCAESHGFKLVSSLPHLSQTLENSIWNRRGWTYQEMLLSSRCLFFTSAQVYFLCKSALWSESTEDRKGWEARIDKPQPPFLDPNRFIRGSDPKIGSRDRQIDTFFHQLREYTRRSLSFESDTLNAFSGIIARSGFYSYQGIPILIPRDFVFNDGFTGQFWLESQRFIHIAFTKGLLWKSVWPIRSKCDEMNTILPSWSWACLRNETEYCAKVTSSGLMAHSAGSFVESVALFSVRRRTGEVIDLPTLVSETGSKRSIIPAESAILEIKSGVVTVRLVESGSKNLYHAFNAHDASSSKRDQGFLKRNIMATIDNPHQEGLRERLERDEFQAIRLCQIPEDVSTFSAWMLLDRHGEMYRRIGLIEVFGTSYFDYGVGPTMTIAVV